MKNIYSQALFLSIFFGFLVFTLPARAEEAASSSLSTPDLSSVVKTLEKADDFLKSDSVQKVKGKAMPILNKLNAWRLEKLPEITALKEKAKVKLDLVKESEKDTFENAQSGTASLEEITKSPIGRSPFVTAEYYFYAMAEKAFASKSAFYGALIILILAVIVKIKNVVLN